MPETLLKPNQAIQFLMPLSSAKAATEEEGGGQWLHVLPIGEWETRYQWPWLNTKTVKISAAELADYERNFRSNIPAVDIALDEEHHGGPAPGWVKDLRAEGDGLWARVEWTPIGETLLQNRAYRYISPEFFPKEFPYIDARSGREIPNVLIGVGLTNRPFFEELPAVAERRRDGTLIYTGPATEPDKGDTAMPETPAAPAPPNTGTDPGRTPDEVEALRAERDRLAAENATLEATAAERKTQEQLEKLTARFAATKTKDGQLAQAHAERLAALAIEVPEDKRDEHVAATIEALEKGIVPKGERGGTGVHVSGGDVNPALFAAAERLQVPAEFVYMAAIRGQGGFVTREGARQAVTAMGPLTASTEIPSLSYQETMTLTRAMFLAGYETTEALVTKFANRVGPMSERSVDYRGLGAPPRMREWLDEIQAAVFNSLEPFLVTVRDWEATVEIPLTEFKADKLGEYAMRIQQMGGFAKQHPDELLAALIVAAETTLCYDGQNLCDTDHSEGASGSQSNLLTTGGDDNDIADIATDLGTAIATFHRFKDDRGQYLRIGSRPNTVYDVVCRPEVLNLFDQLATSQRISGSDNQWKGRIRPIGIPELSTANEWFLAYTDGPVKPFIAQYQEEPSALKELGPNSEHCKKTGRIWVSTQGHYTVAPGDWRYIIKIQKS